MMLRSVVPGGVVLSERTTRRTVDGIAGRAILGSVGDFGPAADWKANDASPISVNQTELIRLNAPARAIALAISLSVNDKPSASRTRGAASRLPPVDFGSRARLVN